MTLNILSRRLLLASATLLASTLTTSCSDDGYGNPTVRGDYPLRRVNGAPLPYVTTSADGVKTEVLDDVFSLFSGNTFSEISHVRVTVNGQVTTQTLSETGTYGGQGTGLLFSYNSGKAARQSTFNNRTLEFREQGVVREYIKD